MSISIEHTRRFLQSLSGNRRGIAAVEFAMIAPVLLFLGVGFVQFGMVLNQYVELTDGVRVAARQLALSRTDASAYTDTLAAAGNATTNLNADSLNWYVCIDTAGGTCASGAATRCSTNTTCTTSLTTAGAGKAVTITATYSCSLVVMGHDFLPGCRLSSSTTEMLE
jgi:Flp pilus assembly protein TadG